MRRLRSSGFNLPSGPRRFAIVLGLAAAVDGAEEEAGFFWSLLRFGYGGFDGFAEFEEKTAGRAVRQVRLALVRWGGSLSLVAAYLGLTFPVALIKSGDQLL